ncbi:BTB/POZ domain-containing protein KCTD17 [Holothuria leucospilota]|uniref:BTB/POZ domain-containing protein KCTD17 n=1 Tax=Holothuria leucospilota TaxID=206669 RepID=A0A9Q1H019_HOLLE|nr:BTB/POZ domain-containing protein KCTD17 [Holothuria leucospilota]
MRDTPSNQELPNDSVQLPAADLVDKFEWLKFNVGGELLETTRASIDKLKSEFFALLLDSDMYETPAHEAGGAVYRIDRDPDVLKVFFNYGRYGKVVAIPDHVSETFLLEEGSFYKIDEKILQDIRNFFVERRKGPSNVHLERVSITEMAMDKRLMHHNVYGIIRETEIFCYTNIPGHGACHADVGTYFLLEKPRDKCKYVPFCHLKSGTDII